jgi:hypothetical protein
MFEHGNLILLALLGEMFVVYEFQRLNENVGDRKGKREKKKRAIFKTLHSYMHSS